MSQPRVPEEIVKLAHALVEDTRLRNWFYTLEKLPKRLRKQWFAEMARQMRADKKVSILRMRPPHSPGRSFTKQFWTQFANAPAKPRLRTCGAISGDWVNRPYLSPLLSRKRTTKAMPRSG